MRKTLWIGGVLLLAAAFGTSRAKADVLDTYTISFSGADAPTVVGSNLLTYDATTGDFTTPSIEVDYQGTDYTLALDVPGANNPPTSDSIIWDNGAVMELHIFDSTTSDILYAGPSGDIGPYMVNGSVALTPTPEPGTLLLSLTGFSFLGLVMVLRKRKTFLPSQAN